MKHPRLFFYVDNFTRDTHVIISLTIRTKLVLIATLFSLALNYSFLNLITKDANFNPLGRSIKVCYH